MSSKSQPGSDFTPVSRRAMASSRLASFKDYVAQMDYTALSSRVRGSRENGQRQTWDQWARQALWKPYGSSTSVPRAAVGVEKVQLFPGWAVRRPVNPSRVNDDGKDGFFLRVLRAKSKAVARGGIWLGRLYFWFCIKCATSRSRDAFSKGILSSCKRYIKDQGSLLSAVFMSLFLFWQVMRPFQSSLLFLHPRVHLHNRDPRVSRDLTRHQGHLLNLCHLIILNN